MKKILILCLFLFGCDGLGVFSHEHGEGICVTQKLYADGADDWSCKDNITQKECLEDVPENGVDYAVYNHWTATTMPCDEWEE